MKSKISYSALYQLGLFTGSLMKRDLSEFLKYGITQTTVNELRAQVDNFAMLEPDESFEQDQMLATQERNKVSEELKTAIISPTKSVSTKQPEGTAPPNNENKNEEGENV